LGGKRRSDRLKEGHAFEKRGGHDYGAERKAMRSRSLRIYDVRTEGGEIGYRRSESCTNTSKGGPLLFRLQGKLETAPG